MLSDILYSCVVKGQMCAQGECLRTRLGWISLLYSTSISVFGWLVRRMLVWMMSLEVLTEANRLKKLLEMLVKLYVTYLRTY